MTQATFLALLARLPALPTPLLCLVPGLCLGICGTGLCEPAAPPAAHASRLPANWDAQFPAHHAPPPSHPWGQDLWVGAPDGSPAELLFEQVQVLEGQIRRDKASVSLARNFAASNLSIVRNDEALGDRPQAAYDRTSAVAEAESGAVCAARLPREEAQLRALLVLDLPRRNALRRQMQSWPKADRDQYARMGVD
jgi:hypothetical protein